MGNFVPSPGYPFANKDPYPHGATNAVSESIVKSHNADEGSNHAPTGTSAWSGAAGFGWSFADEFPFDGEVDVSASLTLTAPVSGSVIFGELVAIDVNGPMTFKQAPGGAPGSAQWENGASATFLSGSTITLASGATANLTGTTNVRGAFVIKASGGPGTYTLENTCTEYLSGETQHLAVSTDVYLAGSASSGSHTDSRTITRQGLTTQSGTSARTAYRANAAAPDSDSDMTVDYDRYSLPTTQAADRVYTVRHTGTVPTTGQRIIVSRMNPATPSAFKADIKREDGTILFTFYASREGFVWLEWNSLAWVPIMSSQYATGTNSGIYGDVW